MRHLVKGRNLTRTSSHRKALLKNLATSLFEHKSIVTTEAKAKELRPYAEKLITKAKNALQKEKLGALPEGQTIDIHNRRIVGKHIRNKAVLQELFDTIAPAVAERNGGYTRIVKLGFRRGDATREAVIQIVDFGPAQDGQVSSKKRKPAAKKSAKNKTATKPTVKKEKPAVEEVKEEAKAPQAEVVNEAPVVETPVAEAPAVEENPVAETPVAETPTSEAPADEAPATPTEEEK